MSKFFNLFVKGIFVGTANIIPGVSGGTIAVVLRIFDSLIDAVNNFFKNPKKHLSFLFPLILGTIFGVAIFSKIIQFLLERFSFETNMFFVGLVIGSVPLIYREAKKKSIKLSYYLISLATFILVVSMSLISTEETSAIVDTSFSGLLKITIFGAISSAAMVIPGISGSFIMVLLGIYNIILVSISQFIDILINSFSLIMSEGIVFTLRYIFTNENFFVLLAIGIGVLIGIIVISKIIDILFKKFFSATYFAILGLIFGSIFSIFNDASTYQSYSLGIPFYAIITGLITLVIGFLISFNFGE